MRFSALLVVLTTMATTAAFAGAPTLSVSQFCKNLTEHKPAEDVAFKDGQDVRGNAVASADLEPQADIPVPDNQLVMITAQQKDLLGLNNAFPFAPELFIGEARLDKDGAVFFNNKKISKAKVSTLCAEKKKEAADPLADVAQPGSKQ